MGMPVRLPDELIQSAQREAEAADRSLPDQIEHWAALGRAAEAILSHADVTALKQRFVTPTIRGKPQTALQEARSILERVAHSTDRSGVLAAIRASGYPLYESDPEHPGLVVQVEANGKRTLGRFESKRFVPIGEPQVTSQAR